ncbi:ribonuclease E activity regulator RraA [Streptomyces sp. NBC_01016]|uniref:ribonuclease E activity regulator RraA n=1 Tax=Streptomyces sp. NBC_01016 TaxID=2903720 RepID=UPI002252364C|nr:ribonuclease E activity regulator RraA [Streptomyces sp. NBC_01016]MCX4835156.1 ribonuclease E activity regulator RraA [Streptomyces sp. NBC_01016]
MSATRIPTPTADLYDEYGDELRVCDVQFTSYGAVRSFTGPVRTVSVYEDNTVLHALLHEPGDGAVVVVDGGASLRTALLGDLMAARARDNGWAGLVIRGAIRDAAVVGVTSVGVQALGSTPRKSAKEDKGEVDVPVTFGGVTFRPGDILHADEDGVVLLPASE